MEDIALLHGSSREMVSERGKSEIGFKDESFIRTDNATKHKENDIQSVNLN